MGRHDHTSATKSGTFIRVSALRWAEAQTQVTAGVTRALLQFLARKSDLYGCTWYAQRTLSEQTGYSERCIRKHLATLTRAGLVRTIHRSRGGMRVTNVYQLVAWPERELLPSSGHPVAGRHVVEDAGSLLQRLEHRHEVPLDADSDAALNKGYEENYTAEDKDAEKTAILDRCLQCLGPWATQKNRRALTRNSESLFAMLSDGVDLNRHVLPTIREMVQGGRRVPRLNSWTYFADAVNSRVQASRKEAAPDTGSDPKEAAPGQAPGDNDTCLTREASPGEGREIEAYLQKIGARKRFGSGFGGF